jgi:hypothetical protein
MALKCQSHETLYNFGTECCFQKIVAHIRQLMAKQLLLKTTCGLPNSECPAVLDVGSPNGVLTSFSSLKRKTINVVLPMQLFWQMILYGA